MSIEDCHIIKVDTNDIGNGKGIRTVVWVAGCSHGVKRLEDRKSGQCYGCHNPETWKWNQGHKLTQKLIDLILDSIDKPHIDGLTISGGDPLFVKNRQGVTELCRQFRARFGNTKSIWLWTGYMYDDVKDLDVMRYIDVLVDGPYICELKDMTLPYCGSSNQRVIRLIDSNPVGIIEDQNSALIPGKHDRTADK